VPIYHWKQKETLRVLPVSFVDAVETRFGFDIEIYKKHKSRSGISAAASAAGAFMESMPGETHLKLKIWYSLPCKAKLACGNAHADNVALPFGWIYFGEKQPVRYYKIESPSELYATVVHPQIELKHQMRVPY
jgi:homoserine kinase